MGAISGHSIPSFSTFSSAQEGRGAPREGQREKELGREEESERTESKVHCVSSFYFKRSPMSSAS